MGDRVSDLMAAVDLLRRRVQQQQQTIAAQAKIIKEHQQKIIFLVHTKADALEIPFMLENQLACLQTATESHSRDIAEIREQLWPGWHDQLRAELKAQRETDKLHDDDRDG